MIGRKCIIDFVSISVKECVETCKNPLQFGRGISLDEKNHLQCHSKSQEKLKESVKLDFDNGLRTSDAS